MRKMLLEILDDETGFFKKKKIGFISWKCRIYRGNSVEISVNIFIEVKTKLELFLFYSLSSQINRLVGLECSSSCAGHD